jgi:hypothetical protein
LAEEESEVRVEEVEREERREWQVDVEETGKREKYGARRTWEV